jgi:hypothetical protein
MDRNAEAVEVLRGREDTRTTPENAVLLGLALVRVGEADAAKALLSELELPATPTAVLLFDSARLRAATGDTDGALKALCQSFEQTPPSRLAAVKAAGRGVPGIRGAGEDGRFRRGAGDQVGDSGVALQRRRRLWELSESGAVRQPVGWREASGKLRRR